MNSTYFNESGGFTKMGNVSNRFAHRLTPEYLDYVYENGEYYGYFYFGGAKILMNMSDPEYRSWFFSNSLRMQEFFNVDGNFYGIKSDWMSYDMSSTNIAASNAWCPTGTLDSGKCTPYGPGEYELANGILLMMHKDSGLRVGVQDVGIGGVSGSWFNNSHRELVLGHTRNVWVKNNPGFLRCIDPSYKINKTINSSVSFGESPLLVEFNAVGLNDSDLENHTVLWEFGDGTSEVGRYVNHTFINNPGDSEVIYNVTMSVIGFDTAIISSYISVNLNASSVFLPPSVPGGSSSGSGSSSSGGSSSPGSYNLFNLSGNSDLDQEYPGGVGNSTSRFIIGIPSFENNTNNVGSSGGNYLRFLFILIILVMVIMFSYWIYNYRKNRKRVITGPLSVNVKI